MFFSFRELTGSFCATHSYPEPFHLMFDNWDETTVKWSNNDIVAKEQFNNYYFDWNDITVLKHVLFCCCCCCSFCAFFSSFEWKPIDSNRRLTVIIDWAKWQLTIIVASSHSIQFTFRTKKNNQTQNVLWYKSHRIQGMFGTFKKMQWLKQISI